MGKIKVAMTVTNLGLNGISSVVMNYCRVLNKDKFDITIFAGKNIDDNYKKECEKLGVSIVELPYRKPTTFQYYFQMFKNIERKKYDIIHVHGNSTAMAIELLIAKIKKIKLRIAHCHSNRSNSFVNNIFKFLFKKLCHFGLACSDIAGKWVYDSDFSVLPNAFDISKFVYNPIDRKKIRDKYKISSEDVVLGHTGRFNETKNQKFLVDVLKELINKNLNYKLMLVGDGPEFNNIKNLALYYGVEKQIIFVGETVDVYKFYSAMDIFLFPSNYEGLGISLLEAQLNGLKCIASINVPKAAEITDNVVFLDINNPLVWKNEIQNATLDRNDINLFDYRIQFYNIKESVKMLENIYEKELKKRG